MCEFLWAEERKGSHVYGGFGKERASYTLLNHLAEAGKASWASALDYPLAHQTGAAQPQATPCLPHHTQSVMDKALS